MGEEEIILRLLRTVRSSASNESCGSVGVISLYAAQCWSLQKRVEEDSVQISTVDAFQGNEKDFVVLSTVRSRSIGFASDPRRINVAITRAKGQLIIVGNRNLLSRDRLWYSILEYISQNGEVIDGSEWARN